MRRPIALLAALLALLALVACGGGDDGSGDADATTTPAEDPVAGRTFASTELEGTGPPLDPDAPIRITFGDDDLTVEAGCDPASGTYAVEGPILVVRDLESTGTGCVPGLIAQDSWITGVLAARPVITPLAPDGLQLSDEGWTLRLTAVDEDDDADSDGAGAAAELVGPAWTLDALIDEEGARSAPAPATITFAEDGTYQVSTGCGSGSGTYTEAGAGVYQVDPPEVADEGCDADGAEVRTAVVAALDGEVTASIEGDRLTLTNAEGAGLSFAAG